MRVYGQGAYFRVTVSEREVYRFARRWPCFGDSRALSFTFDTRNGDLVDVSGHAGMDGNGVAALADDAKAYGAERLKLTL